MATGNAKKRPGEGLEQGNFQQQSRKGMALASDDADDTADAAARPALSWKSIVAPTMGTTTLQGGGVHGAPGS